MEQVGAIIEDAEKRCHGDEEIEFSHEQIIVLPGTLDEPRLTFCYPDLRRAIQNLYGGDVQTPLIMRANCHACCDNARTQVSVVLRASPSRIAGRQRQAMVPYVLRRTTATARPQRVGRSDLVAQAPVARRGAIAKPSGQPPRKLALVDDVEPDEVAADCGADRPPQPAATTHVNVPEILSRSPTVRTCTPSSRYSCSVRSADHLSCHSNLGGHLR